MTSSGFSNFPSFGEGGAAQSPNGVFSSDSRDSDVGAASGPNATTEGPPGSIHDAGQPESASAQGSSRPDSNTAVSQAKHDQCSNNAGAGLGTGVVPGQTTYAGTAPGRGYDAAGPGIQDGVGTGTGINYNTGEGLERAQLYGQQVGHSGAS